MIYLEVFIGTKYIIILDIYKNDGKNPLNHI